MTDEQAAVPLPERRYQIEGRTLGYPTHFADGCNAMALYAVKSAVANELIADSGFRVAEAWPGKALLALTGVHYTDTDCGVYEEMAFAFMVRKFHQPTALPWLGTWIDFIRGTQPSFTWRLPVTSALAEQAGIRMWGYPKTIEDIRFQRGDGRAQFQLHMDGEQVLRFSVSDKGRRETGPLSPPVYSVFEGRPHVGYLTQRYRQSGFQAGGAELVLGDHPWADALKALGLPRRALFSNFNGGLTFSMSAPEPLRL